MPSSTSSGLFFDALGALSPACLAAWFQVTAILVQHGFAFGVPQLEPLCVTQVLQDGEELGHFVAATRVIGGTGNYTFHLWDAPGGLNEHNVELWLRMLRLHQGPVGSNV